MTRIVTDMGSAAAQSQPIPQEILTNQAVVEMVVGKVPKELILAKIRNTNARFDLTAAGLVSLNANKVPRDIIKAMMDVALGPPPTSPDPVATAATPQSTQPSNESSGSMASPRPSAKASTPAAPISTMSATRAPRAPADVASIPTDPGIYVYADEGHGPQFVILEPTVYTAGKTGGVLGNALTGGIAKAKLKAVVRGAEASLRTSDVSAEFYFVFEQKQAGLSNSNAWFGAALSSPNEFQLVRFDVKPTSREVVVGAVSAFGSQTGTEDKANVPFVSTRLKPGLYRVVPTNLLAPGQYAFFGGGGGPSGAVGTTAAQRLFDFGVVP